MYFEFSAQDAIAVFSEGFQFIFSRIDENRCNEADFVRNCICDILIEGNASGKDDCIYPSRYNS